MRLNIKKYKTVKKLSSSEYVVSRSRFIGFVLPADNTTKIQEFIREYSSRYSDATHCCWAYKTGFPENPREYYSDAGEPGGSAGRPILGMISHFELQNVIIIIIRYFGGVKLGIRGLIDAYATSARMAIESSEIIEKQQMATMKIRLPYSLYDTVKHETEIIGGELINPVFESDITCEISVPKDKAKEIADELRAKGGKIITNE